MVHMRFWKSFKHKTKTPWGSTIACFQIYWIKNETIVLLLTPRKTIKTHIKRKIREKSERQPFLVMFYMKKSVFLLVHCFTCKKTSSDKQNKTSRKNREIREIREIRTSAFLSMFNMNKSVFLLIHCFTSKN